VTFNHHLLLALSYTQITLDDVLDGGDSEDLNFPPVKLAEDLISHYERHVLDAARRSVPASPTHRGVWSGPVSSSTGSVERGATIAFGEDESSKGVESGGDSATLMGMFDGDVAGYLTEMLG
jgi:hypothetical protein